MAQPLVAVVIPCYNHGQYVGEAVRSVMGTARMDVELIVVDDGSSDPKTLEAIDHLAADGIEVLRQRNTGLATARNVGIGSTSAPYILPLDADNRIRPGYIDLGVRELEKNARVGVVYGDAEYFGERTGRWSVGRFDEDRLLTMNYIDACAMYRRDVWKEAGGYDASMPVQGYEDWDFWLSAVERGWKFSYIPEILFDYRVSDGSMITRTRGHEEAIKLFVARKHALLYRQAFMRLDDDRRSGRVLLRRLIRVLMCRVLRTSDD